MTVFVWLSSKMEDLQKSSIALLFAAASAPPEMEIMATAFFFPPYINVQGLKDEHSVGRCQAAERHMSRVTFWLLRTSLSSVGVAFSLAVPDLIAVLTRTGLTVELI